MRLDKAIAELRHRFRNHGEFTLGRGESINDAVRSAAVPNQRGIYAIFSGKTSESDLLYVGKAGTFNCDGSWKKQGIGKRLTMKQEGMYRCEFFRELMESENLPGLTFIWFVTYDAECKILPVFAEAQLLQAYHDEHGRLPMLNRCV